MTTTATHTGFLADIIEHPNDDTPRLIYADWLEEHGEEERAEFIRVQVELEKFKYARNVREGDYDATDDISPEWQAAFDLHDREMRLLWLEHPTGDRANWEAWCWAEARNERGEPVRAGGSAFTVTPHCTPGLRGNSCGCTVGTDLGVVKQMFRRGFIAEVHCPLAIWLQHGPALAAAHPIEFVRLTDREPRQIVDDFEWCLCHTFDRSAQGTRTHRLPCEFYDMGSTHPLFPTPEAAHAWASERALAWARKS